MYLRGAQYLPYGRAAHAMDVLCALAVAPATILAAVREAAGRLGPFVDRVRMLLRAQPGVHPARTSGGGTPLDRVGPQLGVPTEQEVSRE